MKSLRVWLLVLLAFALPLRGAMAAAMACGSAATHVHGVAAAGHGHAHAAHDSATQHAHAAHDHAASGHAGPGKCGDCASCCSATAPVSFAFALPQAPPATTLFPECRAPAAEFFCGGQERPPRSI